MHRYLISAAILTLLGAPSAWSDPPSDRGNKGHEGNGRAEQNHQAPARQSDRGPAPQAAMQAPPNRGNQDRGLDRRGPAPQAAMQAPPNRSDNDRRDNGRRAFNDNRPDNGGDRRTFNDNRATPPAINRPDNNRVNNNRPDNSRQASRDFNRDGRTDFRQGRGAGPRHDFSGFRDYHRNFHVSRRFQAPSYRRPAGWYSHRWGFGEFLPAAFWARDYWLIDFSIYDLPPPPYGAVWVRVDRDALLIDEDSGEIITVAYDVFY